MTGCIHYPPKDSDFLEKGIGLNNNRDTLNVLPFTLAVPFPLFLKRGLGGLEQTYSSLQKPTLPTSSDAPRLRGGTPRGSARANIVG